MECGRKRKSWSGFFIVCPALVIAYFAAYLLCGTSGYTPALHYQVRRYDADWLGKAFVPAAWLEAKVRRKTVHIQRSNVYGHFESDYVVEP